MIKAMTYSLYVEMIGHRVYKVRAGGRGKTSNIKPFKSGKIYNTIKGIIMHPYLKVPAFIFEEDESYVECSMCDLIKE